MGASHGAAAAALDPAESSAGVLDAPRFPQRITRANQYVEQEYQGMVSAHHKLKELAKQREDAFKQLAGPLQQECKSIHDNLQALADAQGACKQAQDTALPTLFEMKSKSKWGGVNGCAKATDNDSITAAECKCAAGSLASGCTDAQADSDHRLVCSHVREALLPEMKLRKLFNPGGPCAIDAKAKYNEALLPGDEPSNFKLPAGIAEESMPLSPDVLLLLASAAKSSPDLPKKMKKSRASQSPEGPSSDAYQFL